MSVEILHGDCRETLKTLPDASVNCCVTSPPYFGLRDYGHDAQIGLEESPDAFVQQMVGVFREVRRVLRDDGTLWLNLGDSYAAQRGGTHQPAETLAGGKNGKTEQGANVNRDRHDGYNPTRFASRIGLKHKDLIGIPWRVAFALQADGWYLRQDIIWHKPNPMPESVADRCTKAHEYIFLLSKSAKYYFDSGTIKETAVGGTSKGNGKRLAEQAISRTGGVISGGIEKSTLGTSAEETRNRRSVWTVTTKPYKEAHFATFPTDLIRPCILAGCPTSGTVLDPFGGSGTTGQVAMEEGRNAILCELNADYVGLIRKRIDGVTPSLFGRAA
jgi:site-specific DNA-methyltransferase (adenine-specific)